jgi:hypothetical protein
MDKLTFYDIHMHAFNLSHPAASAFLRRIMREVGRNLIRLRHLGRTSIIIGLSLVLAVLWAGFAVAYLIPPVRRRVRSLIQKGFDRVRKQMQSSLNLLSVLENDVGSFFFLMEDCLREKENPVLDDHNEFHVGGRTYSEIVLTPLMMDFGYKGKRPLASTSRKWSYHYDKPAGKPIVEQVVDVFNAIKTYTSAQSTPDLQKKYPSFAQGTKRVLRIYPFLGLNTADYDINGVRKLLDKYFKDYTGLKDDLDQNVGAFNGDIDSIASNFFAGIKVYPPLGFDPWPDNPAEREKVTELYAYANRQQIPITCHGGHGGFRVVTRDEAKALAAISKWEQVLEGYENLKLDLAHFPMNLTERTRRDQTLELVLRCRNVYVDISCRATTEKYYRDLATFLEGLEEDRRSTLMDRLLFGSDFAVNLMWIESYNRYVALFSETGALKPEEKLALCSTNPERFLFRQSAEASGGQH